MEKVLNYEIFIKNLSIFEKLYDFVRIVDPLKKTAYTVIENKLDKENNPCYDFWKQNKICQNCISIRAYKDNKDYVKIEFNGKKLFMITAIPIVSDKGKFVVEFLKDVTDDLRIEGIDIKDIVGTYNKINEMNDLVVKDELTGLYNRRFINERLDVEIIRAKTNNQSISLIMADIDYFKKVNDKYGHLAGDEVLIQFAKILKKSIRKETDWAARYGGEEFLICINNVYPNKVYDLAERIRKKIENTTIKYEDKEIKITASFGIAVLNENISTGIDLVKKADEKLYTAKIEGRNKVVI